MNAAPKKSDDRDLDEALSGTFPASDPVAPSHVEDEMERRRKVLEDDAKRRQEEQRRSQASHSDALLDEGLDETFPASDPVAVHHIDEPPPDLNPGSKPVGKKKTRRGLARATGKRTGQKKTRSKKRKSLHGAPDTRRKKAPRKKSARR